MQEELKTDILEEDEIIDLKDLVLYNDDVNTFEYVIELLVKYCHHSTTQAEQCAYIVHYKGKCQVKRGQYEKLKPIPS
jgi:ATP-dependent Clp protease adaptor protein ClpS